MNAKKEALGVLAQEKTHTLIKKAGEKGDKILPHNHPEARVIFVPVSGHLRVQLDEDVYDMKPGACLEFDGEKSISAEFLETSEIFITLILK